MENSPLLIPDPAEGRKIFWGNLAETSKNEVFEAQKGRRRRNIWGPKINRHYGESPPVIAGFSTREGGFSQCFLRFWEKGLKFSAAFGGQKKVQKRVKNTKKSWKSWEKRVKNTKKQQKVGKKGLKHKIGAFGAEKGLKKD